MAILDQGISSNLIQKYLGKNVEGVDRLSIITD